MFLVTTVRTRATLDEEGNAVSESTPEASVSELQGDVDNILKLKAAGDDRVANTRAFALTVDENGRPTIGDEIVAS